MPACSGLHAHADQQSSLLQLLAQRKGAYSGRPDINQQSRGFASSAGSDNSSSGQQAAGLESERLAPTTRLQDLVAGATERIAQKQVGTLGQLPEQLAAEAASLEHQLASSSGRSGHTHDLDGAGALADRLASAAAAGGPDGRAGGADGAAVTAGQRLLHNKYGYAALGGVVPDGGEMMAAAGPAAVLRSVTAAQPRLHPRRRFQPGQTYEPQDLNPYSSASPESRQRGVGVAVPRPSVAEVLEKADYKNVAFLTRWFLSPAGRLLPRRQTRLPVAVHKHVSRQVRLARHMGLIAGEARLDKTHVQALREVEAAQLLAGRLVAGAEAGAQQQAAAGAGAGAGAAPRQRYNELLDFGA
ncbi:hypothetical protein CHLRE_09g388282v5 [Chlamydomonas reinhardtii]|uniref:Small ribosomal subunit protein bS18c n=1 Tax=Chlamydomonas reinhardtii TaxID=3055 RepID=A0A2K3DDW6_CHLRE|nr:uncharacterized protein CHLRE_09g388282v5 [Chlamydomonas reinhardtii]PNW78732.1 hypothetical protein CHLRE_09g388282v5 [Chlamydomonas reinhardtii]7PKQ_r Chain r, bS18m [Chlamydomonas reinhardtii]